MLYYYPPIESLANRLLPDIGLGDRVPRVNQNEL